MSKSAGLLRRLVPKQPCAAVYAGQPTHATHPELLAEGEVWPGVSGAEFAARRQRLADLLPIGGVALLPAAQKVCMTGAIPYPYRQDSDFLYLTGISQQAVAVLESSSSRAGGRLTLFISDATPQDETWNGAVMTPDAASSVFGADEVYPFSELEDHLERLLCSAGSIHFDAGEQRGTQPCQPRALLAALRAHQHRVQALHPLLHSMRWRKSAAELDLMRRSAQLAAGGLRRCMQMSRPGIHEHLLAAAFEYECKAGGAQRMAYPPVVAGGASACTIHYLRNDKRVGDGELVLMDAGCELHGYASDVTRTWPVSGTFSRAQRTVYELVLDTHRQCVEECVPGRTLRQMHARSVALLSEGLAQLGVFPGLSADAIAQNSYRVLYPHSVGHWLGMDTHDTRSVGHDAPMQEGVVVTVEPGLYFPPDLALYGPFAGIGVRIEDDVAVTRGAPEVLSGGVPVAAAEIERLVGAAP